MFIISIIVATIFVGFFYTMFQLQVKKFRKSELKARLKQFSSIVHGTTWKPSDAIEWLLRGLTATHSVRKYDRTIYNGVTLEELKIDPEILRSTLIRYFQLWITQATSYKPILTEALRGPAWIDKELAWMLELMTKASLTLADLEQSEESLQVVKLEWIKRCCQVLEDNLVHYPGKPWQRVPVEAIREALLNYWWGEVSPELLEKWSNWAAVANTRHAQRLLTRLRSFHYSYPASNEQVNHLLDYLRLAGAKPEDIGTSDQELQKLRG